MSNVSFAESDFRAVALLTTAAETSVLEAVGVFSRIIAVTKSAFARATSASVPTMPQASLQISESILAPKEVATVTMSF